MPRLAGSKNHYTFVLRNENTGRYVKGVSIALPSSTYIIKATLAAPQLVPWAYAQTRDAVAGAVSTLVDQGVPASTIVDEFSDADELEQFLKENKLRPVDVRDARADEGREAHDLLESLAGQANPLSYALKHRNDAQGYERAILDWWAERTPEVVGAEMVLPCPKYGYCGTTDLVWKDHREGGVVVTDLKTRGVGKGVYVSDRFQVDSYITAYEELSGPVARGTVLVVRPDGSWIEKEVGVPRGSFLQIKQVYDLVKGVK